MWPHYTRQISSPHHSINIQLQVVYTTSTNDWCPRIWNPFRIDHPFPINFFTWKKERKIKLYNLYGYQKWGRKHCYCNKWIWYCTQWKFTHKKPIKEREYLWIATSSLNANYICHQNNNNRFYFFWKWEEERKRNKTSWIACVELEHEHVYVTKNLPSVSSQLPLHIPLHWNHSFYHSSSKQSLISSVSKTRHYQIKS